MVYKFILVIKRHLTAFSFLIIFVAGCDVLNMLPNSARDRWYTEHGPEMAAYVDRMSQVKIGMSKDEAIGIAGQPTYKRTEDVLGAPVDEWIYTHRYWDSRYYVVFEDGKVASVRSH